MIHAFLFFYKLSGTEQTIRAWFVIETFSITTVAIP